MKRVIYGEFTVLPSFLTRPQSSLMIGREEKRERGVLFVSLLSKSTLDRTIIRDDWGRVSLHLRFYDLTFLYFETRLNSPDEILVTI